MAGSYALFGVHDWAAPAPPRSLHVGLCFLTFRFGVWVFRRREGLYAGLSISTCLGLWLFTRILIPDVILTGTIALSALGVFASAG